MQNSFSINPALGIPLTNSVFERLIRDNGGDLSSNGNFRRLKGETLEELFSQSTGVDRNFIQEHDDRSMSNTTIDFKLPQLTYNQMQFGWAFSISLESKAIKGNTIQKTPQTTAEINITSDERIFGAGNFHLDLAGNVGMADMYFITFSGNTVSKSLINHANNMNVSINYIVPYLLPDGGIYFGIRTDLRSKVRRKGIHIPLEIGTLLTRSFLNPIKINPKLVNKVKRLLNLKKNDIDQD